MSVPLLNHAIIGCGRVAPNHVSGVRDSGVAAVVCACDRDPDLAAAFALTHGIPGVATDYREVIDRNDLFSVSIAVDHSQHAHVARDALLAGKHVLVEKPTAIAPAEARALVALAAERGLRFATIAQHRFDPLFQELKRLVEAGALGRLVSLWATLICGRAPSYYGDSYWRGTWRGEGGSLMINQAYHCIDLMVALAGQPTVLSCHTDILKLGDVLETEDVAVATLAFPGGALGSLGCVSATTEFWRSRIQVVGSEGSLAFDIDHPAKLHYAELADGVDVSRLAEAQASAAKLAPGIEYYGVSHNAQIADFLQSAAEGRPCGTAPEWGPATLSVIAELYRVARAGREVDALRGAAS